MELAALIANVVVLFSPWLGIGHFKPSCDPNMTFRPSVTKMTSNNRPYTILVEGIVGSGKSTLVDYFSNRFVILINVFYFSQYSFCINAIRRIIILSYVDLLR